VAFAHAQGVLHRDLKPPNIMLGPFGEVLIMDWGVAKELNPAVDRTEPGPSAAGPASAGQTLHGTILGTPGYMAPEQAQGAIDQLDARTDVYALGAILYFLLTGQAPVHESPGGSAAVSDAPLVRPRRLARSIPRPLEAICVKALAGRREERYGGALELGRDVADFLAQRRVQAYPERALEAALRLAVRYRAPLALILAYLVMRVLLLVFLGH
jgi:serine/threonine protein kinase